MAVLIKLGDNLVPVNSLIIGGKEPNLQEKNVDITSNGTSEVLPDGQYTGLSKVNINANVPDSIPLCYPSLSISLDQMNIHCWKTDTETD